MALSSLLQLALATAALAHGDHTQKTMQGPHPSLWYSTLPGDGGTQVRFILAVNMVNKNRLTLHESQADSVFSGITTFGRLPYLPCLGHKDIEYDIAFIGTVSHNWCTLFTLVNNLL